jgi:hypothetical protein
MFCLIRLVTGVAGYVFWSLFQALAPMVWYFPMSSGTISGQEVHAVVLFIPVIAGIPFVFPLLSNRWVLGLLRLGSVLCLASLQAPTALLRLQVLSAGVGLAMLVFTVTLWSPCQRIR